jgi:ribosomal protein S18 acetylase RimI-like enzyme
VTELRRASTDDATALLELWRRAEAAPSVTDTVADVERVIASDGACALVAIDNGAIVGSIIVTFDGWRAHFYRLAVDPRLRRQGVARRLVEEAEKWLHARDARRLTAIVEEHRPVAQAFWSAVGFEHHRDARRYTKSG